MTLLHDSLILVTGVSSILRTVVDLVCVTSSMTGSLFSVPCDLCCPAKGPGQVDECNDDSSFTAAFDLILIDALLFSFFLAPAEFGS